MYNFDHYLKPQLFLSNCEDRPLLRPACFWWVHFSQPPNWWCSPYLKMQEYLFPKPSTWSSQGDPVMLCSLIDFFKWILKWRSSTYEQLESLTVFEEACIQAQLGSMNDLACLCAGGKNRHRLGNFYITCNICSQHPILLYSVCYRLHAQRTFGWCGRVVLRVDLAPLFAHRSTETGQVICSACKLALSACNAPWGTPSSFKLSNLLGSSREKSVYNWLFLSETLGKAFSAGCCWTNMPVIFLHLSVSASRHFRF